MKRKDLLEEARTKENKFNPESIVKKDEISIDNLIGQKKLDLMEAEEAVKDFLVNDKASLDQQFLVVYKEVAIIEADIETLKEIKGKYL